MFLFYHKLYERDVEIKGNYSCFVAYASSSWHSRATPRDTQKSGERSEGNCMAVTKLVDKPVLERVPARAEVRYSGHA